MSGNSAELIRMAKELEAMDAEWICYEQLRDETEMAGTVAEVLFNFMHPECLELFSKYQDDDRYLLSFDCSTISTYIASPDIVAYEAACRRAQQDIVDCISPVGSRFYEAMCRAEQHKKEYVDTAAKVIAGVMLAMTGTFIFFPEAAKSFFPWLAE